MPDATERQKEVARRSVLYAVRTGRLDRLPCEVCGAVPTDGHHDDYDKPLDVRWLCKVHHALRHVEMRNARRAEHQLPRQTISMRELQRKGSADPVFVYRSNRDGTMTMLGLWLPKGHLAVLGVDAQ